MFCAVLYMELSYTGSLDQSTRASEHVIVHYGYAFTAAFNNFFKGVVFFFKQSYWLMFLFYCGRYCFCLWAKLFHVHALRNKLCCS